jgi:hypothetical protein
MTKRIITIALAFTACCLCWAPFKDLRQGVTRPGEATQDELSREQSFNRVQGQVGTVPMKTDEVPQQSVQSDNGNNNLADAAAKVEGANNIRKATNRIADEPTTGKNAFWGLGVLILGLGSAYGVRVWANRTIPEPPKPKKITW